ncbi:MAG: hypothetical protein KDA47_16855, partial [Planctomycetales bacterium]|nr:hypothetical protein [Planctomycetales bacterium]
RIRAGIDAAAHSSHRRTAAHRTRLWSMISLAAAACVLLAVFLWPQRQPFRSPLQIIAYQLPGASEWLDWESHGKTRASFPENTSVRLAPIAVDNRSLLVFDGREAPAIVPLTKLEHERWELRLGPRLASFIVIESPPDEERDALLDELGRALAHVSLEKGVLLAFADTGVQAQLTEIRGTGEAPKPPAWAEQVAEILTRHGLDAQGYALPIVTPEEAP